MKSRPKCGKKVATKKPDSAIAFLSPGHVNLNLLTSKNWKGELSLFFSAYGHLDHKDLTTCIPLHTEKHRRRVLFSVIGELVRGKRIGQLSMVKPRHLDWLAEKWHKEGVSVSHQFNNYSHLKWFWKVCSIKAPPYPRKDLSPEIMSD